MNCLEFVEYNRRIEDGSTFGAFGAAHFVEVVQWSHSTSDCWRGPLEQEDAVITWLRTEDEIDGAHMKTPTARLRLLAIPHSPKNRETLLPLPISKSLFQVISEHMQLSQSYIQVLSSGMATYLRSPTLPHHDSWECAKFIFQENSYSSCPFSIALTYKLSTRTAFALMFGAPLATWLGVHDCIMDGIFRYLTIASPAIAAPMLLPVMIKELMARNWNRYVDQCHQEVFDVELATKMRKGLVNVPYITITDDTVPDLKSIDLVEITRSLNSVSTKLAFSSMQCRSSLQVLSFIAGIHKDFQSKAILPTNDDLDSIQSSLAAKIEHLQSWLEGIEARCTYLTQRAQAQVQTVYSLIAQRDNAVNMQIAEASRRIAEASRLDNLAMREIAEDSKAVALATARDSAAMRVIAAVTILFLPATFTATLFSASFFDFHPRNPSKVVSTWVWLYCVVTIILTLLIQGAWYISSRRKEQQVVKAMAPTPATEGLTKAIGDTSNNAVGPENVVTKDE